ncbi:MAG: DNA-directed RNA polymerase subunit omega [Firmicutes bacterium]|nr:DNA-directed RNA polymerase subunit omega [Bacillota bacterium]
MLVSPSLDDLLEKVASKYELITMVSKRARQINVGSPRLVDTSSAKPVTIAMEEIVQGKIRARMHETKGGK